VIYTGHNEFLERRIYGKIRQAHTPFRALRRAAGHLRTTTLLSRITTALTDSELDQAEAIDAAPADLHFVRGRVLEKLKHTSLLRN
jgi:hypothetical protein